MWQRHKYKRCCLARLEAVARELRDRDAGGLIAWLRSEHEQDIEEAGRRAAMIRILRGLTGQSMSMVWAINDYRPADGGLPLIERYAARAELSEAERAIARGLGDSAKDPAQAALALLEFHPDDVAEPLPETVDLQAVMWSIEDEEAVLGAIEDDGSWECLGKALPDGAGRSHGPMMRRRARSTSAGGRSGLGRSRQHG